MAAALLQQGSQSIRDAIKGVISHLGLSTDNTAFVDTQTTLNPGGGTNIIKAATETDVDYRTFDVSATITSADGTGSFFTVGVLDGAAATDAMSRSVRTNPIGIDVGDTYTATARVRVTDAS